MFLAQSTARDITVFMVDSADHVTGKTGLTLAVQVSKAAASFASISPTVTELAFGWYKIALTSGHTDTLGELDFHISATGADPADFKRFVIPTVLYAGMFTGAEFMPVDAHKPNFSSSAGTLTVKKPDGTTTAYTKAVTTDAAAEPIIGVS